MRGDAVYYGFTWGRKRKWLREPLTSPVRVTVWDIVR